jgi:g-D-glutamyl-meso-diaminopimelate peptidase
LEYSYFDNQLTLLKTRISHEVIGHSVMGKEIVAFKLGEGIREVHYNGAIHANEWITAALLLRFISDYSYASGKAELKSGTSVWIVPLLNPDGVELVMEGITEGHLFGQQLLTWNNYSPDFSGWKANIRGVDLNDQFPAHWERERIRRNVQEPGPANYSGAAPLSEPEAIAIATFTMRHSFELTIALHTQGEEIYWNYCELEPPESCGIADKFAKASGYLAVKLFDSDAGYKDWFIQQFHRPGFTIEAGYGHNPLPFEQFDSIYEKVSKILWLGLECRGS